MKLYTDACYTNEGRLESNAPLTSNPDMFSESCSTLVELDDCWDCWVKLYDKPDFNEDGTVDFYDPQTRETIRCTVRSPGQHPGGNAWWLNPDAPVYCYEQMYMNLHTGSVDTYGGWFYEGEDGVDHNAVDDGDVMPVKWDFESETWVEI